MPNSRDVMEALARQERERDDDCLMLSSEEVRAWLFEQAQQWRKPEPYDDDWPN